MTDAPTPDEIDASDLGPGWRVLVWRDGDAWYSLAENDADLPGSGLAMPVVLAVEQEFSARAEAIDGARRRIQVLRSQL